MTPSQSDKLLKSAVAFHQAGKLGEAMALYDRVRGALPRNFDAVHLGGVAALQQGQTEAADQLLAQARKLNPKSALASFRHGIALTQLRRLGEGEAALQKALGLDPQLPEAWFYLAANLRQQGRFDAAVAAYGRALALKPNYAEAHERLGALLIVIRGHAAAEPHLRRGAELQPKAAVPWCNLGICLCFLGRLGEALGAFARALEIDPRLDQAHAGKGLTLERCYRLAASVESYDQALAVNPCNFEAHSARLYALQYLADRPREYLFEQHRRFGAAVALAARPVFPNSREAGRRLRLGFLSPDLHRHSVAYFLEPLLAHLDRAEFEIFLYHDQPVVDSMSERLRGLATQWQVVAGFSADLLEEKLRADRLDVLFDLAGHTGMNRLPLFARRLAPVQATYLGYPDTTGLPAMDYRFVDAISDPPGTADALCTERLVRFAPTAWTYAPPAEAPAPAAPPSAAGTGIAFGCFNNFAKVTDAALLAWSRILQAVPGSRLVLKGAGLTVPALRAELNRRLESNRIPLERVELLERTKTIAEHLAAYSRIDLSLDTYPYHGTTTTCEALWMGVPVITRVGDRHASRVGASLLQAVGHPEWVASDWDEYVAHAVALAGDERRRTELRQQLRRDLQASALLDHCGQAERFGRAVRGLWSDFCRDVLETAEGQAA